MLTGVLPCDARPEFGDEGIRAAPALRAELPALPILVLSRYVEQTCAAELLDSGDARGLGYLQKDRVGDAAVCRHIGNMFAKLELPPAEDDHRRVRAVLASLCR